MTKKRIIVKIGDVFWIKDTNPKRYLQFVYIDDEALGSDVVVVYEDNPENYDFYMHTFVMEGVQDGLWERVDHKNVTFDLSTFAFKTYSEPSI